MPTAEHCRVMAAEADRLASIVSYARDKDRLREQARTWRDKAEALDTRGPTPEAPTTPSLMGWLRRRVG